MLFTSNVGRSTIKGVDADLDVLVTPTTRVSGSVQYLDSKYDSFITYAPNQGTPPNYACPYTPVMRNGSAQLQLDCSGKPGVNGPKWSFNVNLEQTFTLGDYKLVAQGDTRYRGAYYIAATYQPWTYSPGALPFRRVIDAVADRGPVFHLGVHQQHRRQAQHHLGRAGRDRHAGRYHHRAAHLWRARQFRLK